MFISFLSIPLFAADKGIGLTVGLDYLGKNMWRGIPVFTNGVSIDGAFFPYISYDILDTGLSLRAEGEIAESYIIDGNKTYKEDNAINFALEYSNKFGIVTLDAGAWYFMVKNSDWSYSEFYVSATLEDIILSPMVKFTYDYYYSDKELYVKEKAKDFYIQLGISHTCDLAADVASLTFGALGGYYKSTAFKTSGISDIDLSAELEVKNGPVTYSAGFHYLIVPSEDYYYSGESYNGKLIKDRNRFYSTFATSYSF
jgi:hypothetical protein